MLTRMTTTNEDRPDAGPTTRAPAMDEALRVFLAERTRLLRLADRVLRDSSAAEDVVQDVWLRWQRVDHAAVRNPAAFLTTATRRTALNVAQSGPHRHEVPAQDPTDSFASGADPSEHVERDARIEQSIGLLMTRLRPAELAALVLRACFDYPYIELAEILGTTAPHARQLVRRARLGLSSGRGRERPLDEEQRLRLAQAFARASDAGDLSELVMLLVGSARESAPRQHLLVMPAA